MSVGGEEMHLVVVADSQKFAISRGDLRAQTCLVLGDGRSRLEPRESGASISSFFSRISDLVSIYA